MNTGRCFWGGCAVVLSLATIACGDDGGSGGTSGSGSGGNGGGGNDGTPTSGATTSTADAASSASSSTLASSSSGAPVCDRDAFVVDADEATQVDPTFTYYVAAQFPDEDSVDQLTIQWFDERLEVGEDELVAANYDTCTLCVLIDANCDQGGNTSTCEKTFLVTAGSLVVESATGDLVGTMRDAVFVEVTIDENLHSEPVPGGETWCIGELAFDVPIAVAE